MSVDLQFAAGVATLTFSAGQVNLYSLALHDEFDAALDSIEANQPRVLVVKADGKIVSGGVDVAQFYAQKSEAATKALYDRMLELPNRFANLEMPTIFVAHGLTLTWALEVALACDLLFASQNARFGLVERVIGLTPTMGGTQRLAERAGLARAKEFVFSGALYDAATLERWNVVNRIFSPESLAEGVAEFAADLAAGPTKAFGAAKELLRLLEDDGLAASLAETTSIAASLFHTEDLQHGMESFLTNGPGNAQFNGR